MKRTVCAVGLIIVLGIVTACGNTPAVSKEEPASVPVTKEPESRNQQTVAEEADYYSVCTSYSKEEVEDFAYRIKQQVMDKEWTALAEQIAYPITISSVTYETQEAFCAENWDDCLDDAFYEEIESESCTNMFCNYQGIMFGNGKIWIAEVLDSNKNSQGLKVVAISK